MRPAINDPVFVFQPNYPCHPGYTVLAMAARTGALSSITGRGVTIAFIDSGFYPHPDLAGRVLCHVDATSRQIVEGGRFNSPASYSWHGQMTSVIAAGAGETFPGLACESTLVLIKVSTVHKQIKERDILRGLQWLLANYQRFGVRVLNLSVGGDFESLDPEHPIHRAIAQLSAAGIVVCVAAGNAPSAPLVPPASAPSAITVGGYSDENEMYPDCRTLYPSSWGLAYDGTPKPELLAPARWIASPILPGSAMSQRARWLAQMLDREADEPIVRALLKDGYTDLGLSWQEAFSPNATMYEKLQAQIEKDKLIDAGHQHVDGTSVAVAIVSSIVAQLLEVRPSLSPGDVKALLTGTADPMADVPREVQGGGMVNPARVLAAAGAA
jgi:serine protease AprX